MIILLLMLLAVGMIISKICSIIYSIHYKMKIDSLLESINDKEDLLYIRFKDFPSIMAEVFKRKGYKVSFTDKCGEYGSGLVLNDLQFAEIWKNGLNHIVDVEIAMNLAKRMQSNSVYKGMLITLGDFKQNTRMFCHKNVIECINGEQLLDMCKQVQKRRVILEVH